MTSRTYVFERTGIEIEDVPSTESSFSQGSAVLRGCEVIYPALYAAAMRPHAYVINRCTADRSRISTPLLPPSGGWVTGLCMFLIGCFFI